MLCIGYDSNEGVTPHTTTGRCAYIFVCCPIQKISYKCKTRFLANKLYKVYQGENEIIEKWPYVLWKYFGWSIGTPLKNMSKTK